ncbi:hypothetical protein UFOVP87_36 [uncultured Caudovirales phage]|uniref:Phage protein n=1 Tax=uncultured Caudovirales phage TaxID=2100421 RepID=A0A6J5KX64_9CAUD|nr:hypothetical protein UFOVP87_36 [uncultured Caudovirales phage]
MDRLIKKIEMYKESNDACFDFANSKTSTIEKVMDMAFLIGKMKGQLNTIQIELEVLKYKNKQS